MYLELHLTLDFAVDRYVGFAYILVSYMYGHGWTVN